jgi:uncharacterized membrane protein
MEEETDAFADIMEVVARIFEAIAAAILLLGLVWAAALAWRVYRRTGSGQTAYRTLREAFGGAILLGLEVLVAGDLIRTVAVSPTLESAVTLGIIVLIRTLLSFSLQVEIEGSLPWRRAMVSGATMARQAHRNAAAAPAASEDAASS